MSRTKITTLPHTPRVWANTWLFSSKALNNSCMAEYLVIALELLKAPIMNTIIMNQGILKSAISRRDNRSELPLSSRLDEIVHTPAFIKADASNKTDRNRQQPTSSKQVRRFGWDTLHRTRPSAFPCHRCSLPYLKDGNAASRNCRVSHCRFSDTALYSPGNPESDIYASELSFLAGDTLRHPALRALKLLFISRKLSIFALLVVPTKQ